MFKKNKNAVFSLRMRSHVLERYIAHELLLYFCISFLFLFVIFFVNQILLLAERVLQKHVDVFSVLRLIWYCLPALAAQSSPFATLLGFLMSLGRMVTDNEIMILRAGGQKYSIVLKPVLGMGILISLFSFIMNDYFLPLGTIKYNRLFRQIIQSNPAIELESQSIKYLNGSTLVIGEVDNETVSDLVVIDAQSDDTQRIICASESSIQKSMQEGVLMQLNMSDALVFIINRKQVDNFDFLSSQLLTLNVFESSILNVEGGTAPREMTSYDLYKKIKNLRIKSPSSKAVINSYNLELNKKFSIPFASIFFAILALPLSLILGTKDGQTLGLIFGVIISVLYWACTIMGQIFGLRSGLNGFWMMWTPNFVIGLLGILLYLKLKTK